MRDIYDKFGNKIGSIRESYDGLLGTILVAALIIGLVYKIGWYTVSMVWYVVSTVHSLTPYPNLNGVITLLAIPLIVFPISARLEKIVRGEVGVFAEFGRIAAILQW
jgi:hypothetical protein